MDVWMPCASHEQHSECAACWFERQLADLQAVDGTAGIGSPSLNLNSWHISRSWATRSFHWRMRSQLKYSVLQMRRSAELLGSPSAWNTRSHKFNAVRKSLVGSAYRLWIRSASSRFSSGRSRGSCRLQERDHHQHCGQRVRRGRLRSLDDHTAQTHVDRNACQHDGRYASAPPRHACAPRPSARSAR